MKSNSREDEQYKEQLEVLRHQIAQGIEELDRGEGIPAAKVFAQMKEKAKAIQRSYIIRLANGE